MGQPCNKEKHHDLNEQWKANFNIEVKVSKIDVKPEVFDKNQKLDYELTFCYLFGFFF